MSYIYVFNVILHYYLDLITGFDALAEIVLRIRSQPVSHGLKSFERPFRWLIDIYSDTDIDIEAQSRDIEIFRYLY